MGGFSKRKEKGEERRRKRINRRKSKRMRMNGIEGEKMRLLFLVEGNPIFNHNDRIPIWGQRIKRRKSKRRRRKRIKRKKRRPKSIYVESTLTFVQNG